MYSHAEGFATFQMRCLVATRGRSLLPGLESLQMTVDGGRGELGPKSGVPSLDRLAWDVAPKSTSPKS